MLSFLNSIVLPALLAVSIPIIIHFFNRRKVKKIPFSSIRFLKLLENQRIKQVRLYQFLLILIRTLFILFLVLAFARATLTATFLPATRSARTTGVILLDDSYSMQGFEKSVTKFHLALDYLNKILSLFDPADQVFILPVSSVESNVNQVDLGTDFSGLVKRYSAGFNTPDYAEAFQQSETIFKNNPNFNKELYLISDLRFNRFQFPDTLPAYFKNEPVKFFIANPEREEELNTIGIDTVIIETRLFEINKPVHFTVRLHNYNDEVGREALLNLFLDDNRVALDQMIIPPAQAKEMSLSYVPKTTGYQFLHFELDDDALPVDNHYYISFLIPEKRDILFVTQRVQPEILLALETLNAGTPLNFENVNYTQWIGKTFEKYDLIVLNDPPALNNDLIGRLKQYALNKNLLIIPGLSQTIKQANALFNVIAGKNILLDLQSVAGDAFYFPLDPKLPLLPLFAPVFSGEAAPADLPKISKYFRLSEIVDPIIRLENGDPLFAQVETEANGNLFIFSSNFDLDWNDIPVKGFFIPMLYRILFTTAQEYQDQKPIRVGSDYSATVAGPIGERFSLQISDAESYDIFPEQSATGLQFIFKDIAKPGHYIIRENTAIIHAFSANVSPRELKPPYVNPEHLIANTIRLDTSGDFANQIAASRTGQELWYVFLTLALLMLISEMLLVHKIERQNTA